MTSTGELRAAALPAALDRVQDLLQQLWTSAADVEPVDRWRFESAVVEIAGNIIQHSSAGDESAVTMDLKVICSPTVLRAAFCDDGAPADVEMTAVVMPDVDAEDGRGLALATAMTDRLRYERAGDQNRWEIECVRSGRQRLP